MTKRFFKHKTNRLLLLLVLFVAACSQKLEPQTSCNFVQNSELQRVSWKGELPITLYINNSVPEEFHQAIVDAAATWNAKLGAGVFSIQDHVLTPSKPGKDGFSAIYWDLTWENDKHLEQARTTISWKGSSIEEADIVVNASHDFSYSVEAVTPPNKIDFQSLMVHEMGHVLGLQHIEKGHASVMEATLASGDNTRREPGHLDLESLKCEY